MIRHTPGTWSEKISYFFLPLLISSVFIGCGPSPAHINNWQKEGAIEPLIATLKDSEWNTRGKAATALGNLKDNRAVDPLLKVALNDKDAYVRKKATLALGKIRSAEAADALNVLMRQASQEFCKERTELYHMLVSRFPQGAIKAPEKCQAIHDCIICGRPAVDFCLRKQGWVCEDHLCNTSE